VNKVLQNRIEGGADRGAGLKVALLQPHHVVAHLLNPHEKELPRLENGQPNPAAQLPVDASRSLTFVFAKIFKGDRAKSGRAMAQFEQYWTEVGAFKEMCDFWRSNFARKLATKAAAVAANEIGEPVNKGPLETAIHRLKLQEMAAVVSHWNTFFSSGGSELAYAVEMVHSITAGCVRVERSVKIQKMIHSKVRNRLLHRKVEMLVQIYMNARLSSKIVNDITALEDMLEAESEPEMERVLGDIIDEAIRDVENEEEVTDLTDEGGMPNTL
jgi:hypothetical protein